MTRTDFQEPFLSLQLDLEDLGIHTKINLLLSKRVPQIAILSLENISVGKHLLYKRSEKCEKYKW